MDMTMTQKLEKGLSATATTTVTAANTALVMGSGDLEVFATPSMVALMEHAAMTAVAPALPEGSTTVGAEMNTTHIKPSGLGASVTATAILTEVDGRGARLFRRGLQSGDPAFCLFSGPNDMNSY